MKKILFLLLVVSTSVFAESSPRELSLKLYDLMAVDASVKQMSDSMRNMLEKQVEANKNIPDSKKDDAQKIFTDIINLQMSIYSDPSIKDHIANAYQEMYSDEELKGLVDFFESPAGQAFATKGSQISHHLQSFIRSKLQEIQPGLKAKEQELHKLLAE
ncbi:DUF2059 domain-containing protein [Vibrio parahaemolyticus]|nr:DUF2059 domain-containing protein [Vibrio parahaemolyticus]